MNGFKGFAPDESKVVATLRFEIDTSARSHQTGQEISKTKEVFKSQTLQNSPNSQELRLLLTVLSMSMGFDGEAIEAMWVSTLSLNLYECPFELLDDREFIRMLLYRATTKNVKAASLNLAVHKVFDPQGSNWYCYACGDRSSVFTHLA